MESIAERIKQLRDSKHLSMGKLEKIIGSSNGSVNQWEKGVSIPGGQNLINLSNFFGVSIDWILKGEEAPLKSPADSTSFFNEKRDVVSHFDNLISSLEETDQAFINRYIELALFRQRSNSNTEEPIKSEPSSKSTSVRESASQYSTSTIPILGRAAAGVPIELVRFIEGYLRVPDKFKNCFAVKVEGESMVNAGIQNGGYVVVRQQESVDNNDIALVKVDEGVTIKRFRREGNLAYLISENENMRELVYDPSDTDMKVLGLIVDIISPDKAESLVVEEL